MNYTKKEREEYNNQRAWTCARLGITENQYNAMRRIGQAIHKCYEKECNGEYADEAAYNAAVEPLEQKVVEYAGKLGLQVYFQGDPRGASLYVDKEPIPANNYTRAACIY